MVKENDHNLDNWSADISDDIHIVGAFSLPVYSPQAALEKTQQKKAFFSMIPPIH